jgi:2,6-dihydroxypyridine 3-monooxygenase
MEDTVAHARRPVSHVSQAFLSTRLSVSRAIVMGGSLAGLSAAIFLREAGVEVAVYERSRRPLEGRGAGIVLHPAVFRALGRKPADISAQAVVLRYLDRAGTIANEQPCSYWFISYATLHRALLARFDAARYHLGSEVLGFAQRGDTVEVELAGGQTASADMLVCADGISSTARRTLLPDIEPRYAGYVGWRGTVAESELSAEAFATFNTAITYCVVPNSHILVYPIPSLEGSLDSGRRLINWVWYRNVEEGPALDALLTDRKGVRRPVSLGTGEVRDENIAALAAAAEQTLPPQLVELVSKSAEPFVQVVFDVGVPSMAFGRIALVGDSAFALRPHVAAGTAKATEDAWTLARAVAAAPDDIPGALETWERGQLELGRAATKRARDAGERSQFENSWQVGDPLPFGLYESGDSLLTVHA